MQKPGEGRVPRAQQSQVVDLRGAGVGAEVVGRRHHFQLAPVRGEGTLGTAVEEEALRGGDGLGDGQHGADYQ